MSNPRKPADRRQNHLTHDVGIIPRESSGVVPAGESHWLPATSETWNEFWLSPLAGQVEQSDRGALSRLFWLYDETARLTAAIEEVGRVVAGSQGQPRANPLYKQVQEFHAEARQLEDRFGLSPLARLRLGITFADASASLDALNSRMSGRDVVPADLWDHVEG